MFKVLRNLGGVDFEIFEFDRGVADAGVADAGVADAGGADAGQVFHELHAESQNRDFVHLCCRTGWIQ